LKSFLPCNLWITFLLISRYIKRNYILLIVRFVCFKVFVRFACLNFSIYKLERLRKYFTLYNSNIAQQKNTFFFAPRCVYNLASGCSCFSCSIIWAAISASFFICLTPRSSMISSLPPGIAIARTSLLSRSTFSPCPPRV